MFYEFALLLVIIIVLTVDNWRFFWAELTVDLFWPVHSARNLHAPVETLERPGGRGLLPLGRRSAPECKLDFFSIHRPRAILSITNVFTNSFYVRVLQIWPFSTRRCGTRTSRADVSRPQGKTNGRIELRRRGQPVVIQREKERTQRNKNLKTIYEI